MNRRRADAVIGIVVAAVLVFGGALSWQAFQQNRAFDQMMGSMMDSSMAGVHGTNPFWYVGGTILVAGAIGGFYLAFRDELTSADEAVQVAGGGATETATPPEATDGDETTEMTETAGSAAGTESSAASNRPSRPQILDVLPEDERRILEPVVTSPGITQIELRDRSNFSKSKVSQTVSELEKRGLLYREKQGRTYRVYPSDDLTQNHAQ
ncbi:helix-turn-helix transcriptional regulator [Haloferax sp. DFSO52]|uniref:helix-turn-helix transcriptional regulator n=1 Tax=Haloferax sp. DFSO52 TaxID=3388505 RepID=UPI003A844DAC